MDSGTVRGEPRQVVLALLTRTPDAVVPFVGVGMFLDLLAFPRIDHYLQKARAASGRARATA